MQKNKKLPWGDPYASGQDPLESQPEHFQTTQQEETSEPVWNDEGFDNQQPEQAQQPRQTQQATQAQTATAPQPVTAPKPVRFPAGKRETVFGLVMLICSLIMCNFTIYGGLNLGFGIAVTLYIACAVGYLLVSGRRLTPYSISLLVFSVVIAAGFGRSDHAPMKNAMLLALIFSINLALCLIAGQNRHSPGTAGSVADAMSTLFSMGYGQMSSALGGFMGTLKGKESLGKKIGAILVGILVMLPVVGILMPLLVDADAAFEGFMRMIPEIDLGQALVTVGGGLLLFCIFYTRCTALVHRPWRDAAEQRSRKGINKLTVNTVLIGVCVVYLLYLVSQLAYFIGGFAGIVPEKYTLAEYARRGFAEMISLCVVNMVIIILAEVLVRKNPAGMPLSTRILCLFIMLTTVFMAVASSAKMITYISGYGLTRMRVMSQLVIVFIAVAAVTVSINLFLKKPQYMPVLLITALVLGSLAFWMDVDSVVASYNVTAYQKGILSEVDMDYLETLSNGAVPYIAELADDDDPEVAKKAKKILRRTYANWDDFRDWNYADWRAKKASEQWKEKTEQRW